MKTDTDKFWSEKLIWALGSGKLKKITAQYQPKREKFCSSTYICRSDGCNSTERTPELNLLDRLVISLICLVMWFFTKYLVQFSYRLVNTGTK